MGRKANTCLSLSCFNGAKGTEYSMDPALRSVGLINTILHQYL